VTAFATTIDRCQGVLIMKRTVRGCTAVLLVLCSVWVSACGDDDGGNGGSPLSSLPVDATQSMPGLPAQVQVVFDDLGMPHVYGPDFISVTFAQGYLTAQARFFEMDVFRRFAEGRLSELLGAATFPTDVEMRTVFTTRDGRRLQDAIWEHVQQVDPEVAEVAQAYADGVNAWLADLRAGQNGATIPPEYTDGILIRETPETLDDWRPQDTAAIARLQAYSLSESASSEVGMARNLQLLPEALFKDVFRAAPAAPTTIINGGSDGSTARSSTGRTWSKDHLPPVSTLAAVADVLERLQTANPLGSLARGVGSNNWIVSPDLSANGHAMLANDPHLQLFNPPIWHMIQLNVEEQDLSVTGVIFPGLPGVILGHNNYGAWGATTAGYDVSDVYVEQVASPPDYPASPRTTLWKGEQVPVLRIEEEFHIRNRPSRAQVIEIVPHHGPMMPDPLVSDDIVGIAATGMSFRWTGHEITNDFRFLFDLIQARDVGDFRDALAFFSVGAQNWIWADLSGDIAFDSHCLMPQRPAGVVPFLPVSGAGDADWLTDDSGQTLWLPRERIPNAINPAEGFLASANNDQLGNTLDNDPLNDEVYLAFSAAEGFRAQRIRELLTNETGARPQGAKISFEDMSRYQYDHQSKEAERLVPFLHAAASRRADLVTATMSEALARLEAWGQAKPDSAAYDTVSGIDAHDLRDDVPPRSAPVSAEEKADAAATSIFVAWSGRLSRAVFRDDFTGTGVGTPGGSDATKALLHILEDLDRTDDAFRVHTKGDNGESTLWDDRSTPEVVETSDEIMLAALASALTFLSDQFDTAEQDAWLWGLIHQVNFQHFIGQAGIPAYDLGPFPAPGARSTVNPASYSLNSDSYVFSGGPSMRFVAVLDPKGIRSVNILPGGNNGNPGRTAESGSSGLYNTINPEIHYGDHVGGWINGEVFEYRLTPQEVADHAERNVIFTP
jgi:penicillin amidase